MEKLRSSDRVRNILHVRGGLQKQKYKFTFNPSQIEAEIVSHTSHKGEDGLNDIFNINERKSNTRKSFRGSPQAFLSLRKLSTTYNDAVLESVCESLIFFYYLQS